MKVSILIWGCLVPVLCYHGDYSTALSKSEILKKEILDVLELLDRDRYGNDDSNEEITRLWLRHTNQELRKGLEAVSLASWRYETDITTHNANLYDKVSTTFATWKKKISEEAAKKLNMAGLSSQSRRQLRLLSQDSDPPDPADLIKLQETKSKLEEIYAKARVVNGTEVYKMEPELTERMAKSRDPQKLSYYWKEWRDASGKKMKVLYQQLVELMNKGAVYNKYSDIGEYWRSTEFDETPTLENDVENLWEQLQPLYLNLHAFVRKRLRNFYSNITQPSYKFPDDGTIPAHLLGNMWAQEWESIYDTVKPFPDVPEEDLDDAMKKQKYTIHSMFTTAENFYTSLGLFNMTEDFWKNSMLKRPNEKGREVQCHASAFDFYTDTVFRIKMCTVVNMEYLETIHHEMGHIEYFMAYRKQPAIYRDGANCAFHEAIGDTISLSVRSRKHLQTLGLLSQSNAQNSEYQKKQDINFLMKKALFKIAFLPFGYLIDKWRWSVFDGSTPPDQYNRQWWNLRLKYQGVTSPVPRSESDFDPGAKFHIPANSPYLCYFVSFIIQFQFYEALCDASGHTGQLHTCDFYQSRDAGDKFRAMLELGASRPWRDAMSVLTGQRQVRADSIKKYFQPLQEWLEQENQGETLGWQGATINWSNQ